MVVRDDPMNHSPYLLFHQSPEQLRRIGARGGKAQARNRRDRLGGEPHRPPPRVTPLLPASQSTAAAIAALDAQFPWLRGAEKRSTPCSPQR
jgi:hypothetical protein